MLSFLRSLTHRSVNTDELEAVTSALVDRRGSAAPISCIVLTFEIRSESQ